jgi:hypothetical protein
LANAIPKTLKAAITAMLKKADTLKKIWDIIMKPET